MKSLFCIIKFICILIWIAIMQACSIVSTSISICATGEYEDHIEYHLNNQEYQRMYGLRWDPYQKRIYFGDSYWYNYKNPANSRISAGD